MPDVVQQKSDEKNKEGPPPDPAVALEMQKIEIEKQKNEAKAQLDQQKQQQETQLAIQQQQFDQAITLLQSTLEKEPDGRELGLKLLEVFAAQGDLSAFEVQ